MTKSTAPHIHYFLAGFMGAGKSFALSHMKKLFSDDFDSFIELDSLVASKWGDQELGQLIDQYGLTEFRSREKKEILNILSTSQKTFTALGGGSLEAYPELLDDKRALVVWLNTPFEICLERVRKDQLERPDQRPLAKLSDADLLDLYKKREAIFKKAKIHAGVENFLQVQCQNDLKNLLEIRRPASF